MKGISVVVCCYNSTNRLHQTLKHLALQKTDGSFPWEVIIVNNNSTDDTGEKAFNEWEKHARHDVDFRVIDQPTPGLSYAREKGVGVAQYDYIVFCDDDNWLFDTYVSHAFKAIQVNESIGIVGGFGIAKAETELPQWFQKYSGFYATGHQQTSNGQNENEVLYVYGAGAVVKKSIFLDLKKINFKFLASDRNSNKLNSGGDVELCYIAILLGYTIGYDEKLKFYHFIEEKRLNQKYIIDLAFQFGYCNTLHRPYFWQFNPSLPNCKKHWFWVMAISIHIYFIALFKKLICKKNEIMARKVNLSHATGRLIAIVKLNNNINRAYKKLQEILSSKTNSLKPNFPS